VGLHNALGSLEASDGEKPEDLGQDFGVVYPVVGTSFERRPGPPGPVPGARAPHAWVDRLGSRVSMLDLYDDRLTLVTGAGGERWHRAADELAGHGLPVTVVRLGHEVRDPSGAAARAYDLSGGAAVLVRPDGHIAWRADRSSAVPVPDLAAAVHSALGSVCTAASFATT
jgi:hypothetical protein